MKASQVRRHHGFAAAGETGLYTRHSLVIAAGYRGSRGAPWRNVIAVIDRLNEDGLRVITKQLARLVFGAQPLPSFK